MMPTKTIRLHVAANNAVVGVLSVRVTPWRVHLDAGDKLQWLLDTDGTKNDIEWFRVEEIDRVKKWPFNVEPPHPSYTGISQAGATATVTTPVKGPTTTTGVVSYGLTIGFRDDAGELRIMYIDPDMIIDS
jgi:hypothetical protein